MSKKVEKTNVMRILDQKKVNYNTYSYDNTITNAVEVANSLKQDIKSVFKTLVTIGKSKEHYVFVIPADSELDLKKAAKVSGEKNIEMIHQKELLPLTGYIHGGCSPIGMKKQFTTFIDSTAENYDLICFSGGKVGYQVQLSLNDLKKIIKITCADLTKE